MPTFPFIVTRETCFGDVSEPEHRARVQKFLNAMHLPPVRDWTTVGPVVCRVDDGRWIADCGCGGAELVDPSWPYFVCCSCGAGPHDVTFPKQRVAIEAVLLERPDAPTRRWGPGKSVKQLKRENVVGFHRSWTPPRTWTTGEIVTAAQMNTNVRDDLLETAPAKATAAGDFFYGTGPNAIARTPLAALGSVLRAGASAPEWSADALISAAGQLQLPIQGSAGGILIGGDVQLFRGAANRLDLLSGDTLRLEEIQMPARTSVVAPTSLLAQFTAQRTGTTPNQSLRLLADIESESGGTGLGEWRWGRVSTVDLLKTTWFKGDNSTTEAMVLNHTDGQLDLPVAGSGAGLLLGGDVHFFRGAANRLDFASGDTLRLVAGAYEIDDRSSGQDILKVSRSGEANPFFLIRAEGAVPAASLGWGAGGASALDVILTRGAANRLDLASGDSFNLVSGFMQTGGQAKLLIDGVNAVLAASDIGIAEDNGVLYLQARGFLRVYSDSDNNASGSVLELYHHAVLGGAAGEEVMRVDELGQLRLPIVGSGAGILLGGDVLLFRGAAGRLDLASGDSFNLVGGDITMAAAKTVDGVDVGSHAHTGGSNGPQLAHTSLQLPITEVDITDDFFQGSTTSGEIGMFGWEGTFVTGEYRPTELGNPGIFRFSTTASLNNIANLQLDRVFDGDELFDVESVHRRGTTSPNRDDRVGTADGFTVNQPSAGAYFEALDADTNWFAVTRQGGTQTRTDTAIAKDTAFHRFRVRRTSGSNIEFSIDGTVRASHSANLPTDEQAVGFQIITRVTANRRADIDYCRIRATGLSR